MIFPRRLLICAFSLLSVISCQEEHDPYEQEMEASGDEIICRSGVELKTSLNQDMQLVWTRQDRIMIFADSSRAGTPYSIKELSSDSRTAVFAADGTPVAEQVRYALYPESAFKAYDSQSGHLTVQMASEQDISALPLFASSEGSIFEFANLYGGLVVRPYDIQNRGLCIKSIKVLSRDGYAIAADAVINVKDGQIVGYEGEKDFVEIVLEEPVDINSQGWTSWSSHSSSTFDSVAKEFGIYVPCGKYPSGFDVVLTDDKGRSYSYKTGEMTIRGGVFEHLQYMPLTVYFGSENSVRVSPGTQSVKIDVTPYYTFNRNFTRSGKMVGSDEEIVASSHVIWQQEYGCQTEDIMTTAQSGTVISSSAMLVLTTEPDGKRTLEVPLTGTSGNALVAVSDADGITLWSYHIWVSDAVDISCDTPAGGKYVIMDRNLGATSSNNFSQTTQELVRNSFGLFYQWGRKDPFPRIVHRQGLVNTSEVGAVLPFSCAVLRSDRAIGSIGYTLRNPHCRIYLENDSGCNWLMSYVSELWGFHYSVGDVDRLVAENQVRSGVKTVYDPCPEGYRVADMMHIKGLVELNEDKLTKADRNKYYGFLYDTGAGSQTYIPASGWVKSSTSDAAALFYEGYWGTLWTSSSTASNVYYLLQNADTVSFLAKVRGEMCPVRCVKVEQL